jgi:hypothetical protein
MSETRLIEKLRSYIDIIDSNLDAVKAITDNLPDSGALTTINGYTEKIDSATTDGLTGTSNSLAYRVNEIGRHLHGYERWFGAAASPDTEVHVADRIGVGISAFQIDAGNNIWGDWVQVLGSSDTPAIAGGVKFDLHRLDIVAAERTATYFIQIADGADGATALTNNTYTEFIFTPQSVAGRPAPISIMQARQNAGTKVWARCLCPGQNTATLDFYIGLHEYEG